MLLHKATALLTCKTLLTDNTLLCARTHTRWPPVKNKNLPRKFSKVSAPAYFLYKQNNNKNVRADPYSLAAFQTFSHVRAPAYLAYKYTIGPKLGRRLRICASLYQKTWRYWRTYMTLIYIYIITK